MLNSIGCKIKELRVKNKLSQKDLCGDFINRAVLSKIENNNMLPSIEQLKFISDKLGTNISYFFTDLSLTDCISNNNNYNHNFLSELYNNKNYDEITKILELDYDKYNNLDFFNKSYFVGMSFYNLKLYNKSIKFLRKYINIYPKSKPYIQEQEVINVAIALNTLSKIMLKNSNYEKAKHYLHIAKKYLNIFNKTDSIINFIVHNNLGLTYNSLNEFNKTTVLLEEFLSLNKNMSYLLILPHIHWSLNIAYYNIGEYDASIKHIIKSINIFEYNADFINLGRCYINYINSLRYYLKFDEAYKIIETCKIKYKKDALLYIKFLLQEIIVYFNKGSYDTILNLLDDCNIKDFEKVNKYDLYFILGHIYFLHNNYYDAETYLLKCEKHYVKRNYTYDLTLLYKDLYDITNSNKYLELLNLYKGKPGRKNIVIK